MTIIRLKLLFETMQILVEIQKKKKTIISI